MPPGPPRDDLRRKETDDRRDRGPERPAAELRVFAVSRLRLGGKPLMLTCPMCKKALEPRASPCPRCRADLTLLVDFMSNLDEHLNKADAALKAGELGD